MFTCLEDLPNELLLHLFSTYFNGVQLFKLFFELNHRFDHLLKSLTNIYLRLEHSDDDQCLILFSTNVISLYIDSTHKSLNFIPLLINIRSITLVDPSILQMMYLLQISQTLQHASIRWSNLDSIDLISARSFYELIFSARASASLRTCRLYLPESHSLYVEPKHCILPLLHSIYAQLSLPLADFRRLLRLCPNLIRLEIEILDNGYSNEETILLLLNYYEHETIRRVHIYNLLSLDIFEIYIGYLPNLEKLYLSMKLPSYPLDVFKQLARIIHRIDRLEEFHFRFSTDSWNLGYQQLDILKQLHPFFAHIDIRTENEEIIFTN